MSIHLPFLTLSPPMKKKHLISIFLFLSFLSHSLSSPLNCSDPTRLCTSFLSFKPPFPPTPLLLSMFDVSPPDITHSPSLLFIRKNCSCLRTKYLTNTTFTVRTQNTSLSSAVSHAYSSLAVFPNNSRVVARDRAVVNLRLLCGCSSGLWNYLVTYVIEVGDSISSLARRFNVSVDDVVSVNKGVVLLPGNVYYIPQNSVPGDPYEQISPAPVPAVAMSPGTRSGGFPYAWVIGITGAAIVLLVVAVLSCISCKLMKSFPHLTSNHTKDTDRPVGHKFQILKSSSFCYTSGRYLCCKSVSLKQPPGSTDGRHINIPIGVVGESLDMEKPIVFTYEEILSSTDDFSDSNLLGQGTYGSVYYGVLRDQEVAVKRMTTTKTKEFIAEMKVLCKVHHASLVELIGYAASDNELFLIYEYAHKGSVKSHLHDPHNKGHTSLSWICRVQIALDAARGLEYIHEHTKDHYVHRDVKTSNILLDNTFRAKISDFGLAKLVVKTADGEDFATKVVGTFGYLAPEYLRDGLATTKSDVYAFGVVLFELISGKDAITRTEGVAFTNSERCSLASLMIGVMKKSSNSVNMGCLKEHIDPSLMDLYPYDCVYKLAVLAKQCVDEDPVLRPDMKQAVITLSHILLSSMEWEAGRAGNSQVFSGLVQGR